MPNNANPGLKVNRSINFSSIKTFFAAYVLCGLRLFKLKTEGQTI